MRCLGVGLGGWVGRKVGVCLMWVGGWVGGWEDGPTKGGLCLLSLCIGSRGALSLSLSLIYMGGWVGGWVGG